jgi:TIR domain/Pentapeptide repeats (8 copies)
MIEIIQRRSGRILHRLNGPDFIEASLGRLDLRGADLSGLDFVRADLSGTDLSDASLTDSALTDCNMSGANMSDAVLTRSFVTDGNFFKALLRWSDLRESVVTRVSFREADLQCADLRNARFCDIDFQDARLDESCLRGAAFINCNFRGANLTKAAMGGTAFSRCINLHESRGIHGIGHLGPSSLDLHTLRLSVCALPDDFLIEAGLGPNEIVRLRELYKSSYPGHSGSCFLVYAQKDQKFASLLCQGLRSVGQQAWLCRSQTTQGARTWPWDVHDMLQRHDRVIVICSEHSLTSKMVSDIVDAAVAEERKSREQKLFAVRTDAFLLTDEMRRLAEQKNAPDDFSSNWLRYIRAYLVADFTSWTNPAVFKTELERLTKALLNPARR